MTCTLKRCLAVAASGSVAGSLKVLAPLSLAAHSAGRTSPEPSPFQNVCRKETFQRRFRRIISSASTRKLDACDQGWLETANLLNFRRHLTVKANVEAQKADADGHGDGDAIRPPDLSEDTTLLEAGEDGQAFLNVSPFAVDQVCEILNAKPWGPHILADLEKENVLLDSHIFRRALRRIHSIETALHFFYWLKARESDHDYLTYEVMFYALGSARRIDEIKKLAEEFQKSGHSVRSRLLLKLISSSARAGEVSWIIDFWEKIKLTETNFNAAVYASMFHVLASEKRYKEAVELYLQMLQRGVLPTSRTFQVFIRHLLDAGKVDAAYLIFNQMSKLKLVPRLSSYAYLMAAYAKVGDMAMVKRLGRGLRFLCDKPGNFFCVAIATLRRERKTVEANVLAEHVWPELSSEERKAKVISYLKFLQTNKLKSDDGLCYEEYTDGELVHSEVFDVLENSAPGICKMEWTKDLTKIAKSLDSWDSASSSSLDNLCVEWNSDLVYRMVLQIKESSVAWDFFRWIKQHHGFKHDIYNQIALLRKLSRSGNFSAVEELLSEMQSEGARLSVTTFNMIIRYCGLARNSNAAIWVFNRIKEFNLEPDEESFTGLVHTFAKARRPDLAYMCWKTMKQAGFKVDRHTHTVLIYSLALSGKAEKAESVFQEMLKSGCDPDVYTYTALMKAYSLVGNVDLANKVLEQMKGAGIAPTSVTLGIMARNCRLMGDLVQARKLEKESQKLLPTYREEALISIYESLLEKLVTEERSESLLFTSVQENFQI